MILSLAHVYLYINYPYYRKTYVTLWSVGLAASAMQHEETSESAGAGDVEVDCWMLRLVGMDRLRQPILNDRLAGARECHGGARSWRASHVRRGGTVPSYMRGS